MTLATASRTPFFTLAKQVTPDYWLMLLLVFLMKTGQFMLLPYLALYLSKITHASTAVIGFAVGVGALAYGLAGPFNGYLIDRFGRRRVIILSVFLAGVIFIVFNMGSSIFYYMLMNIAVGLTRCAFDTASRSYKVHSMTLEQKRFCFGLRFACNNAGAGVGPLISVFFIQSEAKVLFILNGLLFIALAILVQCFMKSIDDYAGDLKPPKMSQVFKVMSLDFRLCCIVFAGLVMWVAYSQLDSIFAIYLNETFANGLQILTWTFLVNTSFCILLQMPMARLMTAVDEKVQIYWGSLFYILGFLIIPFTLHVSYLLFASILVVLGEVIIGPLMDLLVYKIAPKNLIGSYYGALAFSIMGVGLGPIIGGCFYQYFNAKVLFLFCVFLFMVMAVALMFAKAEEKSQF